MDTNMRRSQIWNSHRLVYVAGEKHGVGLEVVEDVCAEDVNGTNWDFYKESVKSLFCTGRLFLIRKKQSHYYKRIPMFFLWMEMQRQRCVIAYEGKS